jgi:aryl-alcohol dehydrogenase-like predicted oxidoreductase
MQTRSLGRTDLRLSEITLGTWGLAAQSYGPVAEERFDETVRAALDQGVTTFDVAPTWGDGEAERRVGRLVAEASVDAVIVTRAGARLVDGKLAQSFGVEDLIRDCEGSLRRLGREQIEVWLLHGPGDVTMREEAWREAVDRLEEDGKIRAWGVAVGDAEEARIACAAGAQAICITHNMLSPSDLEDVATDVAAAGCGVLARSPLMYGMLAGQWSTSRYFPETDHRARRWHKVAFTERVRQVDELRFLVGPDHKDLATAALRFVLTNSLVSSAVVGARTPSQVASAVEAASGPPYIGDEDMARYAKIRAASRI